MKFVNYIIALTIGVCIGYHYSQERELKRMRDIAFARAEGK